MRHRIVTPIMLIMAFILSIRPISLAQEKDRNEKQKKEIKAAIEQYIKNDQNLKGGFFVKDAKEGKVLDLSFEELHRGVGQGEDGTSVVCADFKDEKGKLYDLDVYVKKAGAAWSVEKVVIHKVDGEARK